MFVGLPKVAESRTLLYVQAYTRSAPRLSDLSFDSVLTALKHGQRKYSRVVDC